ncbi:MAG: phage tail assembly protein [Alphaproteobacteria bacterium]
MKTRDVELHTGLTVGGETVKHVTVRESNIGDIIDAEKDAEGHLTRFTVENVRRRIVRFGNLDGPISMDIMRKLTETDFELINQACVAIDKEAQAEFEQRGRLGGGDS